MIYILQVQILIAYIFSRFWLTVLLGFLYKMIQNVTRSVIVARSRSICTRPDW